MEAQLLTLAEAAERLRLSTAETFARFARRHGIALVKIGGRVVRVRADDLERAIELHTVQQQPGDVRGSSHG
jgi:excisionase family DNA binding protein